MPGLGEPRPLVVMITVGAEAPERSIQGLTVAAAAASSGAAVSVWLAGESVWFAVPGRAAEFSLPHAAPVDASLALLLLTGTVTVCGPSAARRGLTESDMLPGVVIAGAAAYVEEVLADRVQALVY